jgi:GNAT superfamily N-acetyltransferase
MPSLPIRRARGDELADLVDMWTATSGRLRALGVDQWQYPMPVTVLRAQIAAGTCWVVEDRAGRPVGTVTVDDFADPQLWRAEDEPASALYVHRLLVAPAARRNELGSAMLDWACGRVRKADRAWLRLNARATNARLHRYYLERGFQHVRTVPQIESGALFERDANALVGRATRER